MRKRFFSFILLGLCTTLGVHAQSVSQWCLKTDQGQYIEMARVAMLAAVDGQATFEVVVREGQGAVGVKSITFEKQESDYVAPADDQPIVVTETGPWCMITDQNDSIAMSRVSFLAYVDQTGLFEVVTREGEGATDVKQVRFARGLNDESGGFKPYQEGQEQPSSTTGALWLQTDKGDSQPMSNVAMLANVDASGRFEVVLHEGGSMTNVAYVTFFRDTETAIQQPKVETGEEEEPMLRLMTPVHFELKLSGCGDATNAVVYDMRGAKMASAPVANGTTTIAVGHLMTGVS